MSVPQPERTAESHVLKNYNCQMQMLNNKKTFYPASLSCLCEGTHQRWRMIAYNVLLTSIEITVVIWPRISSLLL